MLNLTSGILFFTVGTVCMTRMFLGPLGFILWILPLVQVRSVFLLKRVLRAVFFLGDGSCRRVYRDCIIFIVFMEVYRNCFIFQMLFLGFRGLKYCF